MRFFARMNLDRRPRHFPRAAGRIALAVGLAALLPAAALPDQNRNHFDSDSLMRSPGFFDLVALGEPGKARWLVLADDNPPSAPNRLVQTEARLPAGAIAAALRRNVTFQDGTASTFVRQGSGHAGVILRMTDEKNFLLLLVDTASGEVVLSRYAGGTSSELGRGQSAFPHPWQKVGARLAGADVAVSFGDRPLFEAKDPKPASGRAGVAAMGPGEASFDEFVVDFQAP